MTDTKQITDQKRLVGEILKGVDRLIKAGDIDQSVREIIRAKEIDPANGYIRAYEERLAYLKQEHEKNIERERTRKEAEEAARVRDEELRKRNEEERKRLEEKRKIEEERKREEHRIKSQQEHAQRPKIDQPVPLQIRQEILESSIRTSEGTGSNAGSQPISRTPSKSDSKVILVVDDDKNMLEMVSHALVSAGYETRSLTSSDEAYVLLKTWAPDLILCDINLETSTMGGFGFYEKIRALHHLHNIPFLFLTGLYDEVILRTAMELGVEDYLVKPISIENLLATVKGKLKRFGAFHKKP